MIDLASAALNAWFGQPEPIDWEAKARADEQRVRRIIAEEAKKK